MHLSLTTTVLLSLLAIILFPQTLANPEKINGIRKKIQFANLSNSEVIPFLVNQIQELKKLNISILVNDRSEFTRLFAEDKFKKGKLGIHPEVTIEQAYKEAAEEIDQNQCTGFTTIDDNFVTTGSSSFDELHEYIHILSEKGGLSSLYKFCTFFNEGCINVFTEELVNATNSNYAIRYPTETSLARRLGEILLNDFYKILFEAVFQGKIKEFFDAIGEMYWKLENSINPLPKYRLNAKQQSIFFSTNIQKWNIAGVLMRIDKLLKRNNHN